MDFWGPSYEPPPISSSISSREPNLRPSEIYASRHISIGSDNEPTLGSVRSVHEYHERGAVVAGIHPSSAGETTRAICLGCSRCVVGLLPYIQVVGCPVHANYHLDHPLHHSANGEYYARDHQPFDYQLSGDSSHVLELPTIGVCVDKI